MNRIITCSDPSKDETRIFCVFFNNKTGKYRVALEDRVFTNTMIADVSFIEAIQAMKKKYYEYFPRG